MQNFLELLFDSQIALRGNVILGCILLAIFIFYFFLKKAVMNGDEKSFQSRLYVHL